MQSELLFGFNLSDNSADTLGIILENNLKERLIIGYSAPESSFILTEEQQVIPDFSKEFAGISTAPYKAGTVLKLHLLIDASSVELFVDDGRLVMTTLYFRQTNLPDLNCFQKVEQAY